MMLISMSDIVYKPMYPLRTMIIIGVILTIIVLLNRKHVINRLLIILLLVFISQRPMLKNQNETTHNLNIDVLFVIDNTVSMNAVDINGSTRLEAAKSDCKKIMDLLPGANFALITYGNVSLVKYPFTTDTAIIKDLIDGMKIIDPIYASGSSLDKPYNNMKTLLTSSNKKDKHKSVVFFMADGELIGNGTSSALSKYKDIRVLIDNGAVLGYGTSTGGKVKITESIALSKIVDLEGYLIDGNSHQVAISKINEASLKDLANNLSIDYYHMTDDIDLSKKIESIKKESVVTDDGNEEIDKDIYYYLTGVLLVLLFIELYHCRRNEQ